VAELPAVEELVLAEDSETFERLGFAVADGGMQVGSVRIGFDGRVGGGIVGWSVAGLEGVELDGLPVPGSLPSGEAAPVEHPNGVVSVDHVVVLTSDLERTTGVFEAAGVRCRRVREADSAKGQVRQGFFRLGEVIVEVVQGTGQPDGSSPADRPASFWGLVFTTAELERCATLIGEDLGPIRDAVQPGRRIAPLRGSAGIGLAVAFISSSDT
jgi:hypothetical protein